VSTAQAVSADPDSGTRFGGARPAALAGFREACGAPALVLAASYLGFGSLIRESGIGLGLGLFSTLSGWALPGQVVAVELHAADAGLVSIFLAVALVNARLMPMVVTLMPLVRRDGRPRWRLYAAAHFVAATGWAIMMIRAPRIARDERLAWFVGFVAPLLVGTLAATALGFVISGSVPPAISLGLVFVNPMYFLLVFAQDLRERAKRLALALGLVVGAAFQVLSPSWGLLATGLVAGTAAFLLERAGRGAS
jgi:predicted branched-subunit amino acid permease